MSTVLSSMVPSGWNSLRFDRLFDRSKESNRPDLPALSVFLDDGVVLRSSREDNHNKLGTDISKYLVVQPGDIVFNKLRTWQGGLGVSRFEGTVSPAYYVCRPYRGTDSRYFHHLLRSKVYLAELARLSKFMPPSQFDIAWDDLRKLNMLLPPLRKQRKIANYLDRETARIDALIKKKRKLINLLVENHQTLITDAVACKHSKDLVPAPPGAIEKISKHWQRYRLKHLAALPITNGLGEKAEYDNPSWPRYIRTTDIAGPTELCSDTFKSLPPSVASKALLQPGDILMTAAGATIGKSFTFNEDYPACFAGYLVRFRPAAALVDGRFIARWMQSATYWADIESNHIKSTIENFSASKYKNLSLTLPPLPEQRAIADYLDHKIAHIEELKQKLNQQINLLREYLQALVTSTVTGEVEVPRVTA